MTGANLAPDTAREISGLKRRVTDLERMLDRMRRDAASAVTPTDFNTPYAQMANGEVSVAIGVLTPMTPTLGIVDDPTGHILVEEETSSFGIRKPGFYEIGGTIRFLDNEGGDPGDRWLAIWNQFPDGNNADPVEILRVPRAAGGSRLSGSRIVYGELDPSRWHLAAGHDANADLTVACEAFWIRFVTTGERPFTGGGG